MTLRVILAVLVFGMSSAAFAAGSGGHSFGVGAILTTPGQDDLNTIIDNINSTQTRSVDKLGSGYEFNLNYMYRFSGSMFALQFRPSYFMQSSGGSGYDVKLSGFTVFPMLRLYPLENNFIHFFMQTGIGYGRLSGSIDGANGSVEWAGGSFGAMAGLGAEFCFTPAHCVAVEGNVRYLPIERNMVTKASNNPGLSTAPTTDSEFEHNNMDVKTSLSGIQGGISYQLHF